MLWAVDVHGVEGKTIGIGNIYFCLQWEVLIELHVERPFLLLELDLSASCLLTLSFIFIFTGFKELSKQKSFSILEKNHIPKISLSHVFACVSIKFVVSAHIFLQECLPQVSLCEICSTLQELRPVHSSCSERGEIKATCMSHSAPNFVWKCLIHSFPVPALRKQ